MNLREFINNLSDKIVALERDENKNGTVENYTKAEAGLIARTVLRALQKEIGKGRRVEIRDFGVFESYFRKPRKGRNPKTGASVEVPVRPKIMFKPGRNLKILINSHAKKAKKEKK